MKVTIQAKLIEVISTDLGSPVRHGNRPFWNCAFHKDRTPSLTLWPDAEHFKCFGCGKYGDAIDWVRERKGMIFREAVEFLKGAVTGESSVPSNRDPRSRIQPQPAHKPTEDWCQRAGLIVTACAQELESRSAEHSRRWLHERGIRRATCERWKIGLNAVERHRHGLLVYEGITIPWFVNDNVVSVKIRHLQSDDPKYRSVSGSRRSGLFLHQDFRPGLPALIVEGEFDALIGWQEARDLVNVGTLGSASNAPDYAAVEQLLTSPLILLCYDSDQPGEIGLDRWEGISPRTRICRIPIGKDLNELFLLTGDIRPWIDSVLRENGVTPTLRPTLLANNQSAIDIAVGSGTLHHPTPTSERGATKC